MNLEDFIKNTDFDTASPDSRHVERFEAKLKNQKTGQKNLWSKMLGVAAAILVLFALSFIFKNETKTAYPNEFTESKEYFNTVINRKLKQLEQQKTPETKQLIKDTKLQLIDLEKDYKTLLNDFEAADNQTLIINMMIRNFQQRIALLEAVSKQLNTIKTTNYETI